MMSASYLRMLAHERFLALLLNRAPTDKRSNDTLRTQAAREIIRETRGEGSNGSAPTTASNGFELLFHKIWRICQNMAAHADQRRNSPRSGELQVTPTITAAPLVVDEPPFSRHGRENGNTVTLPSFSGTGKQLIDSAEFPNRFGAADEVTNSWRRSIEFNESLKAERERRSAQLRKPKYVG
jgi:hypothetical protein